MATKHQLAILPACMLSLGLTACGGGGGGSTPSDPASPALTIVNASVLEGDSGTSNLQFTVTSATAASSDLTVTYSTADGTATAGQDYTAVSAGSVTIAAGSTQGSVSIDVSGDTDIEADETISLTFTAPDGTTYPATATITNDDLPQLSIKDASIAEGDSGTQQLSFTIELDRANPVGDVTVEVSTADGSAEAGSDYTALAAQSVTIPSGQTSATVTVDVQGDTTFEPDQNFTINLANASNASIDAGSATGTISNDDPVIASLSVLDVSISEGNSGTQNLDFTLKLSEAVANDVTVKVNTADISASSSSDYSALSNQVITIPAGHTTATVSVAVAGDTSVENSETFALNLSDVTGNAVIATASATGTISNDDQAVVSVAPASAEEGDGNMVFTVNLDQASTGDVSVDVSTGAASDTASGGSDYTALSTHTVTVPKGQTSATFNVAITDDTDVESNETFTVTLSNPQNASLGTASATGTIDDDDTPQISIGNATVSEGNSGSSNLEFTLRLSQAAIGDVTVDVSTVNGTASAGSDFTALSNQQVTIPASQKTATVSVAVSGDTTVEADEELTVSLSNPSSNALIATAGKTGTGSITNDDSVDISTADANVDEGDSGTATLSFTVNLSGSSDLDTLIDYSLADGTATGGDDYVATGGTLTIPAGQSSGSIDVTVNSDLVVEASETLTLNLTAQDGSRVNVTTASVTGTINNDDRPRISIKDTFVEEGGNGQTAQMVFTVSVDQTLDEDITVDFASADATAGSLATAGVDYTPVSGSLTIPRNSSSATISVDVSGDEAVEADEILTVNLSNASANAEIASGAGSATGTIRNDDKPSVSIAPASSAEGDIGGSNTVDFIVTLSGPANGIVDIDYHTSNGTATDGVDYTGTASATLNIPASVTSGTISIPVIGDLDVEANETFSVMLTGSSANAQISTASAEGTITDDDITTLNDTGVTNCASNSQNDLTCPTASHPMQDGATGRDATLNNDADGRAGFKFTKLDAAGAELSAGAASWACVRDDVTGLIWEIKANDGGDRDKTNTYTWFNSSLDAVVEPIAGADDINPATIDNTEAFVATVNTAQLCGFSDWRLPNVSELFSLTDLGRDNSPALDANYFPNTAAELTWTSVSYRDSAATGLPGHAWAINFTDGHLTPVDKLTSRSIRLVRGDN